MSDTTYNLQPNDGVSRRPIVRLGYRLGEVLSKIGPFMSEGLSGPGKWDAVANTAGAFELYRFLTPGHDSVLTGSALLLAVGACVSRATYLRERPLNLN